MITVMRGQGDGSPAREWGAEQTIRWLREMPIDPSPKSTVMPGDLISLTVAIDDVSVKALHEDRAGVLAAWQERACRRMAAYIEGLVIVEPDQPEGGE